MITDIQLNQIIQTPPERTKFEANDLLAYFTDFIYVSSDERDSKGRKIAVRHEVTPSWKYMDKSRMLELFDRALKSPWCTDYHRRLIKDAKSEMV